IDRLIKAMTEEAPVVLHLDDLHRADAATLRLVRYLALANRASRLLLIVTLRPDEAATPALRRLLGEVTEELGREPNVRALDLARRPRAEMEALAGALLVEGALRAETAAQLAARSEGNPLFLLETLRLLEGEGRLARREAAWEVTAAIGDVGIPTSVRSV